MTALLWPLVALVAVVLAFVVALRVVAVKVPSPIVSRIDSNISDVAARVSALESGVGDHHLLRTKLEELENRVKVIDGRTAPPVRGVR